MYIYIYIYIYIRYSEVKIHYLKYFGMLPSSVNIYIVYDYEIKQAMQFAETIF